MTVGLRGRRSRAALCGAVSLVAAATPALARAPVSWGRAGVDVADYRADSVACGLQGATRDMAGRDEYKQALHGIQVQDSAIDRPSSEDGSERRLTTPDGIDRLRDYALTQHRTMQQQVPALQRFLVSGVERCLAARGYWPFALTRDQARTLGRLARGSQARFAYLHRLAADPAVLSAQQVAPAADPG